jgi:transcription elongation factor Elf1
MRKKGNEKMTPPRPKCPKCGSVRVTKTKEWTLEGGIKNKPILIKLFKCDVCLKSFRTGSPKEGA